MDRRGFLKGAFGGLAAGGVVIAASTADITMFANGLNVGDVVAASAMPVPPKVPGYNLRHGDFVYDAKGSPIGIVDRVDFTVYSGEVTLADDSQCIYMPGRRNLQILVQGMFDPYQR